MDLLAILFNISKEVVLVGKNIIEDPSILCSLRILSLVYENPVQFPHVKYSLYLTGKKQLDR
jgi:hypothetical protein